MLRLRAGTATLLIGPRAAAGVQGSRYCLDSEAEIHQRLMIALHDAAAREAMRRFWAHWQGDHRLSGIKDHSIVDRIARMGVGGPLIVFLVTDTSLHRRDTSAARQKQVTEALQTRNRTMPAHAPVSAPAPVASAAVSAPKRLVGDWTIAEKLTAIVILTADSQKLTDDARQQLKQMLSDPTFLAWLVGSLLVWFVAHFFVVGEVIDMLLAGAALVLGGVGIVMAVQSLIGAAHLIGQFVEATRAATDENDLKKAADILAEIIVMIGITVLIAALTHATTRATSSGLEAKGSVKRPPPERAPTVERLQERPKSGSDTPPKTEKSPSKRASPEVIAQRRATAQSFYEKSGWPQKRIDAHLDGIDFNHPVEVVTLPKGTEVVQYQVPGNPTGNYFAPPGTPAEALGISPEGRVAKTYTTTSDVEVLRSTAADTSTNPNVPPSAQGAGGGTQFFTADKSAFGSAP
ncbi:hypothetical protein JQ543_25405 [Bradyrhizobium diazoefficiens]|nr:polymorphic toxin type 46 domain-containing protein [Bradyrhizobium diazoefficiens]MBR0851106.1 hypothetical protein [Bradyrhizobium diazoefficiens]